MKINQQKALTRVLAHERGYSNHPQDPGGATNKGVTQRVYDAWRRSKGETARSVRSITADEVASVYDEQYWDRANCDRLPGGLDYAVFDYAVNSGVSRAGKDLQRELGVTADGVIGVGTLAAADAVADVAGLIDRLCDRRMRFLRSLRTFKTFGRGWTTRVEGVRSGAKAMAAGRRVVPLASPKVTDGKAPESSVAVTRTKPGIGAILTSAGVSGQTAMSAADQVSPHINESLFGRLALVAFLLLMLGGVGMLAWSFHQRLKEKGVI